MHQRLPLMAFLLAAAALLAAGVPAPLRAQGTAGPAPVSRGQLLYETHCIACHNAQMHWRDGRLVKDWQGLKALVRHWQANAKLDWSEADIVEVSRHLNGVFYRLPQTSDRLSQGQPGRVPLL